MRKIVDNIAALLKVKTLVTLAVIGVFCRLALAGELSSDNVMMITVSVISFYFGTVSERKDVL